MAQERQPPNLSDIVARHERRIFALETKLTALIDDRRLPGVFSFSGALSTFVGIETPAWRPVFATKINLVVPEVLTAPSGADLTIDLTLYGPTTGVVRTLTVPNGSTYVEDAVPFFIPAGGSLTAKVTADAGASDLSIALVPELQ